MVKDLRILAGMLRKLENQIAALAASCGERGYTAPGKYLFELFGSLNLTAETYFPMSELLDEAKTLLAAESAEQGRRHASKPDLGQSTCSSFPQVYPSRIKSCCDMHVMKKQQEARRLSAP
jgi:hypothetical protein